MQSATTTSMTTTSTSSKSGRASRGVIQGWQALLLSAAAALLLGGCGGGASLPDVWDDELPPIGNPGGTGKTVYTPPVSVPSTETYMDKAPAGASTSQRWVSNAYATLPQGASAFQNASLKAWADEIYSKINQQRRNAGLGELTRVPQLERLAQAHARDMALRDYFSHNTPDGLTPWDRLSAIGPPAYNHAGESNAKGQESSSEVVTGWMGSAGHRDVLLNPAYTHVGVGVYYDPSDKDKPIHVAADLIEFIGDPLAASAWGK